MCDSVSDAILRSATSWGESIKSLESEEDQAEKSKGYCGKREPEMLERGWCCYTSTSTSDRCRLLLVINKGHIMNINLISNSFNRWNNRKVLSTTAINGLK